MQNFFKDRDGQTVITQTPNAPIIAWFIFLIIGLFPLPETISHIVDLLGFGAIFTWAWLEIFDGANPFRRLLGIIVMIAIIYLRL